MVIAELGKRVQKHKLIYKLALAQAGITFGHNARRNVSFGSNVLHRILPGMICRAVVSFASKDYVHSVSMSRHLLVRVQAYSESATELLELGAIPTSSHNKL